MGWFGKSEDEKWAEAKLDPSRNAKAARGLSADEIVKRQCKANDERSKSRGSSGSKALRATDWLGR